jgi:hypothetical protein
MLLAFIACSLSLVIRGINFRQLESKTFGVTTLSQDKQSVVEKTLAFLVPGRYFLPFEGIWLRDGAPLTVLDSHESRLDSLALLSVNGIEIQLEALERLKRISNIEHIEFRNCTIGGQGLGKLWELDRLKRVYCIQTTFSAFEPARQELVPSQRIALQELLLKKCKEVDFTKLTSIITVERLRVLSRVSDDDHVFWESVANMHVRELEIGSDPLDFTKAVELPSIVKLAVYAEALDLSCLRKFPNLRDLELSALDSLFFTTCPPLENLTALVLRSNVITSSDIAWLSKFSNIEELELNCDRLDDQTFERFPELPSLTRLRLNQTQITGNSLSTIFRLQNLQELHLDKCRFDLAELLKLTSLKRLKLLSIRGLGISDEELRLLRKQMENIEIIE